MSKLIGDCEGLIPPIVPVIPPHVCSILYPSGAKVNLGATISPGQVMHLPKEMTWPTKQQEGEGEDLYSILMIDPDSPFHHKPELGAYLHWWVVNIPGNKFEHGDHLASYMGAGPLERSGTHRYVFVVYKQGGRIDIKNKNITKKWNLTTRGGQYISQLLQMSVNAGAEYMKPIAMNWFNATFDETVVTFYKKLFCFWASLKLWMAKHTDNTKIKSKTEINYKSEHTVETKSKHRTEMESQTAILKAECKVLYFSLL